MMQYSDIRNQTGIVTNKQCMIVLLNTTFVLMLIITPSLLPAEYADVVLNKRSDAEGVRPVIFSHWFHRIRFRCVVCHSELEFEMRAGANQVTMEEIIQGKFCGACHDGETAWSTEHCDLCHSALPGIKSGIYGGHQTLGPGYW